MINFHFLKILALKFYGQNVSNCCLSKTCLIFSSLRKLCCHRTRIEKSISYGLIIVAILVVLRVETFRGKFKIWTETSGGGGNLPTVIKPLRDQLVPLSGALKITPDLEETHFRERENRDCKMNSGLQKLTWRIKKEARIH